jgi:hypothetical protein
MSIAVIEETKKELARWQRWAAQVLADRGLDPSKWADEVRRKMIDRALRAADEPEAPELPTPVVETRRGANWTPPPYGARSFLTTGDSEFCVYCCKHISRHYNGTEYRCDAGQP